MTSACSLSICLVTAALLIATAPNSFCSSSNGADGEADSNSADAIETGDVGDFAILRCRVGPETRFDHLRWFGPRHSTIPLTVGDRTFATDPRISVERESLGHEEFLNLVISFLSTEDSGVYRCCCHGSHASERTVFLKVIARPTTVHHKSKLTTKVPQVVRLGDNATLECSTWLHVGSRGPREQQQDLDLDWVKLGPWPGAIKTRSSKRWSNSAVSEEGLHGIHQTIRSKMSAMLTIPNVRLDDAGVYECRRSVIGETAFAASSANSARVTLKVHLSRSQQKYFLSTTTPAAAPAAARPTPPSSRADGWWQRSSGSESLPELSGFDQSRVLNDGQSQSSANSQWRGPQDGRWSQSQGSQQPPPPPPPPRQPQGWRPDSEQSWWPPAEQARRNRGSSKKGFYNFAWLYSATIAVLSSAFAAGT